VEEASARKFILLTANGKDFKPLVFDYIAKSTKKTTGCHQINGLILLEPNDEHTQRRVLQGIEDRLRLDGKKITLTQVRDSDLLVEIESNRAARVSRLPRCRFCGEHEEEGA
jgi:hypothetical protein